MWQRLIRRFRYGPLPPGADGWFFWRLNPQWPRHAYRCIEVANGVMVDTEKDESGYGDIVSECEPYGEFRGPILRR